MPTPMQQQYDRIKAQHRDAILLFRLGDFYEMFGQDARDGARILGLTLTQRQNTPMCGVPHHAATGYIHRLLRAGRKVAVCDQVGTPDGKTITEREVVEVLSPGAVFDLDFLDPRTTNHIVALGHLNGALTAAWCDVSTGHLGCNLVPLTNEDETEQAIRGELAHLEPREIVVQESLLEQSPLLQSLAVTNSGMVVNRIPDWGFNRDESVRRLIELFGVEHLGGFGIDSRDDALHPITALLEYLEDNARHVLRHIATITRFHDEQVLLLDDTTIRNLELVRTLRDGDGGFTLIDTIDDCATAMGSRLLRRWILAPSRRAEEIATRLDRVDSLYHAQRTLQDIRSELADVYDLERLVGRLGVEKAHPKDVQAIGITIERAQRVATLLPDSFGADSETGLARTPEEWTDLAAAAAHIRAVLDDEPAVSLTEGGIIRAGVDATLDRLRALRSDSQRILNEYLEEQRELTGVASLKIRHNRMLGHFFEVSPAQAARLPEAYIRRQSLANAERFTTPRLSELEDEINNAYAAAVERERELFLVLRDSLARLLPALSQLAARLAYIDVVGAFARTATVRGYRRPELVSEAVLQIVGGRHPVVEAHLPAGEFVENDLELALDAPRFALITGPNMAGKSTVLRQTALITLMAHIGSFVPAQSAVIGICDRLFCRVGASDNIARGESTFLVEMSETSNILRNATSQSLLIMDEVGRGTSTHDGLAIAWAVSEYILAAIGARTLFATHYHELSTLSHPVFAPYTMAIDHDGDEIVFLKRMIPGAGNRSYGIDVARRAGLPRSVVARARELLAILESGGTLASSADSPNSPDSADSAEARQTAVTADNQEPPAAPYGTRSTQPPATAAHSALFSPGELIVSELASLTPDELSPREALELLYRWHDELNDAPSQA